MATIIITDARTGEKSSYELAEDSTLSLGRMETQDVTLNHSKVSRRHAEIVNRGGVVKVTDKGSSNGTFLNKKRLAKGEDTVVFAGDSIRIAEFDIEIHDEPVDLPDTGSLSTDDLANKNEPAGPTALEFSEDHEHEHPQQRQGVVDLDEQIGNGNDKSPIYEVDIDSSRLDKVNPVALEEHSEPYADVEPEADPPSDTPPQPHAPAPRKKPTGYGWEQLERQKEIVRKRLTDEERKKLQIIFEIKNEIQDRILQYMDLRNLDFTSSKVDEIRARTQNVIRDIISEMSDQIPRWASKKQIAKEVLDEALGLGPLEDFFADESITEVMVNRHDQIYIERNGRLEEAPVRFSNDDAVRAVIERIVGPIGRRIDESSPLVDARLQDGSRVNAVIPPLALKGPCITIRKFSTDPFTIDDLIRFGSLNEDIAVFLQASIAARKNVIVSGGTGSGKTTLLNVLSNFIPDGERIVTIENVAELQLHKDHWIALESRPANIEGKGEISVRELVKNSLRMRPDRIVVGECRGPETIDMIQAMNTGHDGSLTTLHSNSPDDTLNRVETMVLMAGMDLPIKAIREQTMSAVDLIVHTMRYSDGSRHVTHITEVMREVDEHYRIITNDIFRFEQEGIGEHGEVIGEIRPTGYRPSYLRELALRGFPVDEAIFETNL